MGHRRRCIESIGRRRTGEGRITLVYSMCLLHAAGLQPATRDVPVDVIPGLPGGDPWDNANFTSSRGVLNASPDFDSESLAC